MKRFKLLADLWIPFIKSDISIYSAGASFYLILSVCPATLLFFSTLPYFSVSEDFLWQLLVNVLPLSFHPLLKFFLEEIYLGHSLPILSLSALATIWSASKGTLAIMDGLNATLSMELTRGYFRRQIQAIFYFIVFTLCILLILVCLVFSRFILSQFQKRFPTATEGFLWLFRYRSMSVLLFLSVIFCLIYRLLPSEKLSYKFCLLSGFISSLGWTIISFGFSFYVEYIADHNRFYGSIGILLLAGIWLRLCVALLLYGGLYAKIKESGSYHPISIIKRFINDNK